ncbi:MAG TPA: hypothetical protein VIH15_05665 [Casimicrobiaceae bacterium]
MTRNGAPFHGASGEGKTASSAASAQLPDAASAAASPAEKNNPDAISSDAVVTANRCARSI